MLKVVSTVLLIAATVGTVLAVDEDKYLKCNQVGFCRRNRDRAPAQGAKYVLDEAGYQPSVVAGVYTATVTEPAGGPARRLISNITVYKGGIVRISVTEAAGSRDDGLSERFNPEKLVLGAAPLLEKAEGSAEKPSVKLNGDGDYEALLDGGSLGKVVVAGPGKPFSFRYVDAQGAVAIDASNLLFENHMKRPIFANKKKSEEEEEENENEDDEKKYDKDGLWAEKSVFEGVDDDSKPNGPGAVGLDMEFPRADAVFGLPEHATATQRLRNTRGEGKGAFSEPYRLYNLDTHEYESNKPMALYGSVPVVYAHSVSAASTVGVFWLNPTETWVDVSRRESAASAASAASSKKGKNANVNNANNRLRWTSEDGNVDVWVLAGPTPAAVVEQYTRVTGRPALPPVFSIGYHQSKWNYNSQEEVEDVDEGFDKLDMPCDAIWLDIEHTDGKKYFTWDDDKFPEPREMQRQLAAKGRHLVTIADPHLKTDKSYKTYNAAHKHDYLVRDPSGKAPYEGESWPGNSVWVDFLNPNARAWWAGLYGHEAYPASTPTLYAWNDMNEPAVSDGPEGTLPKDAKHHGGLEHRQVHNMYGYLNSMATYKGLVARDAKRRLRPFALSRAFFAGSQRYAAVWTGDNAAKWSHLREVVPMTLSLGTAGLVHSGADVGGFFGNPSAELLIRWYQTAAYLPFFRSHAHIRADRREPWLYGEGPARTIRAAVLERYALLPYWYTLFYAAHVNATPVARPLWYAFPGEQAALRADDEFMLGPSILVRPVLNKGAKTARVYLPAGIWFDSASLQRFDSNGYAFDVDVTIDKIPVFLRAGAVIPRKERVRRSARDMARDPYTLLVTVAGRAAEAAGTLFLDDGESFGFEVEGKMTLVDFRYKDGKLTPSFRASGFTPKEKSARLVEKIVVVGMETSPVSVTAKDSSELGFEFNESSHVLTVKKPIVDIFDPSWEISFNF